MHDFVLAYKVGFYPHNEKPPGTPVDFYFFLLSFQISINLVDFCLPTII